ncbi:MAG TPA: OmpA family protein [Saprospiraceae bacterium]|nr:OmpA family protein [Saprospiraceae bacterium]
MRILLFFLWLTLGLVYFLIWNERETCCTQGFRPSDTSQILSDHPAGNQALDLSQDSGALSGMVEENPETTDAESPEMGCILFRWAKAEPALRPCFDHIRDSLINGLDEGQMIEIIGYYFEDENRIMASGDLGLLRAVQTRDLFSNHVDQSRLKVRSRSIPLRDSMEGKLFESLLMHRIYYNDQVKELDEKTLIYFAYGTNGQLDNRVLEAYAQQLVSRLKNTRDDILLVGHTDDDATEESNLKLGLQRAELIKYLLVNKGLPAGRIKTSSKGESSPIAPNNTEANRSLNRRVELFLVPKQ